jgi:hypothetical protein
MATAPARESSRKVRSLSVRLSEKYFYLAFSMLVAAIVVYGFSFTIGDNLIHPKIPRPTILYFHATAFSAWVVFYILQSVLVRTHNVRLHRTLGWFGAGLAATMVVLGYATSIAMDRFDWHQLNQPDAVPFIAVPFWDISAFAVTVALAVSWRRKPELHRRLMLLATAALTAAAWGRLPTNFFPPLYFYWGVDALILLGVVRDLVVNRRVHRVYLFGLPAFIAGQWAAVYLANHKPESWMKIAHRIVG